MACFIETKNSQVVVYMLHSTYISLLENHTEVFVLVLSSIGVGNSFAVVRLQTASTPS